MKRFFYNVEKITRARFCKQNETLSLFMEDLPRILSPGFVMKKEGEAQNLWERAGFFKFDVELYEDLRAIGTVTMKHYEPTKFTQTEMDLYVDFTSDNKIQSLCLRTEGYAEHTGNNDVRGILYCRSQFQDMCLN